MILAATNAPWHVDPAFRRPGRFDRVLFVPPPDQAARAAILRILCPGKPMESIDFERLAKRTADFSGADLRAAVDVAVEAKLREAMKTGVPKPSDDERRARRGRCPEADDAGMVFHGPQLRALRQPGGRLRRGARVYEAHMNAHFEAPASSLATTATRRRRSNLSCRSAWSRKCRKAHSLLAFCLAQEEKFAEAQRHAEHAVALAPDRPAVHFTLAIVWLQRNDPQKAEAAVREAIAPDPHDARYHWLFGKSRFAKCVGRDLSGRRRRGLGDSS